MAVSPAARVVARNHLVTSNIGLVGYALGKTNVPECNREDLAGHLLIELVKAVERYDATVGTKLSTHLAHALLYQTRQYSEKHEQLIHVPIHRLNARRAHGQEVTDAVYRALDIGMVTDVTQGQPAWHVREFMGRDARRRTPVAAPDALVRQIGDALGAIGAARAEIITLAFGLDGSSPLSDKQIGQHIGKSHQLVTQIRRAALRQLKGIMGS